MPEPQKDGKCKRPVFRAFLSQIPYASTIKNIVFCGKTNITKKVLRFVTAKVLTKLKQNGAALPLRFVL